MIGEDILTTLKEGRRGIFQGRLLVYSRGMRTDSGSPGEGYGKSGRLQTK